MNKIIIAIDGYSSTGKSTVAKQLAKHLGYVYIDSGAMYRAVTYFAMTKGIIDAKHFDADELISKLDDIKIRFVFNSDLGFAEVYLNNVNVEREIRSMEVSNLVSKVSAIPEVRKQLVKQQHAMGEEKGIVMDGRDIGTVVFPNAELKIFMTASAETRATRRYNELKAKGDNVSFEAVLKNVQERDYLDSTRADSPLYKADDAIEIDNSKMTMEEQLQTVLGLVNKVLDN
ncbi:cytidylate kinase [Yeosuana aromativorans]|uniref:Cytidylate kinase n=1 Tax=Yeosuana aromativorans TaxID=288019 RepID=A0A8J3FJC0_9FLAO|nr:(d)CMP kinase [Yeosuana aromativorans]GGK28514.1 cytidylate kinase [Yeosuana aromativorans]